MCIKLSPYYAPHTRILPKILHAFAFILRSSFVNIYFKDSFGCESGSKSRSMDRLRRSLRSSIRKKKNKDAWTDLPQTSSNSGGSRPSSDGGKPHQWQSDEISVRSGTCNFHVKVS